MVAIFCWEGRGGSFTLMFSKVSLVIVSISKKNKKGKLCDVDIAPKIKRFAVKTQEDSTSLQILCNAGNDNLNPTLLLEAAFAEIGETPYTVNRTALYDAEENIFE